MKEPILSQEEFYLIWDQSTDECEDLHESIAAYTTALESALLEKLCGEPIYQTRWEHPYTIWGDVPKADYDSYQQHGYAERRIVYELKERHHG